LDYPCELTAQQRAALITVRLLRGEKLTNQRICEICGYTNRQAAWRLMMGLAELHEDMALTFAQGCWYLIDGL